MLSMKTAKIHNPQSQKTRRRTIPANLAIALILVAFVSASHLVHAQAPPAAIADFNTYTAAVELRLAQQQTSPETYLAPVASNPQSADARLRRGDLIIERISPPTSPDFNPPGALLHHWRATAFAPGATPADFERLMRNINSYPQHFSPEVLQAKLIRHDGDSMQASLRVRQKHVLTVVMDTTYNIHFGQLDPQHGYSTSRSTRIAEIASPGTTSEHPLDASDEHGFLWRLNTYWSYEQRDGGLYLQVEAVSLTRAIPPGVGWLIQPYVDSIPRESLEFTLRSTCNALRK